MLKPICLFVLLMMGGCMFIPDPLYGEIREQTRWRSTGVEYDLAPPPPETVFTGTETVYQRNYVLNERQVAKVGEPVLRVQAFKRYNYVNAKMMLEKAVDITADREKFSLPAGEYPIFGIIELERVPYYVFPSKKRIHLMSDMNGVVQTSVLYDVRNSDKVRLLTDRIRFVPANPSMTRVVTSQEEKLPFMDFEVVYDGIRNNEIRLFHKYAVPGTNGEKGAFDTYTYPADATMISVEGTLIRIIRADNEQIEFIVLKNP